MGWDKVGWGTGSEMLHYWGFFYSILLFFDVLHPPPRPVDSKRPPKGLGGLWKTGLRQELLQEDMKKRCSQSQKKQKEIKCKI